MIYEMEIEGVGSKADETTKPRRPMIIKKLISERVRGMDRRPVKVIPISRTAAVQHCQKEIANR